MAVWLNDNADKLHGYRKVPYILAGGAAGYLKTGQFVDVKITNNKLLNTIGAAVGCTNGQEARSTTSATRASKAGWSTPIIA